jgi:hypothetical protein
VAEAGDYHLGHLYASAWTGASAATKDAALVMATRLLDTLVEWDGWVVTETQALLWPRSGMLYRNGYSVPSNVVPIDLKRATSELARLLIVADLTAESDVENQKLKALTAGPVRLEFGDGVTVKRIPDSVWALLPPGWGLVRSRDNGMRATVRA